MAYRTMALLLTSVTVSVTTKASFRLERPSKTLWYEKIDEKSLGFPSGHAQLSTTFWGPLGIFIKRAMIVVSIILPLLIGFSRIFLRVHWFTDVILGFGIGLLILAIYMLIKDSLEKFIDERSITVKILICLLVLVLFAVPIIFLNYGRVPNDLELISDSLKLMILFTTVSISYSIEGKLIGFHNNIDKWWKYLVRILIGAAFFAAFYFGLSFLFDLIIDAVSWFWIELTLDLIRYGVLGPVIILLAPWVMMKLDV